MAALLSGPWMWCCVAPESGREELLVPVGAGERPPRGADELWTMEAEEDGALSPKVVGVAADAVCEARKPDVEEEVAPLGLRCMVSGRDLDADGDGTGKAISLCSTRIEDSGRASSLVKSSLRAPSSDHSECTEMTAHDSERMRMTATNSEKMQTTPLGILLGPHVVGPDEAIMGPTISAVRSISRSGRVARKFGRRLAERVHSRRSMRRSSWRAKAGTDSPPLFSVQLREVTLAGALAALERKKDCPLLRFLEEVFHCSDFCTTDWMYSMDSGSSRLRQSSYTMPVPRDIPEVAARLLRVPDIISGTTVWRLHTDANELLLVQHSQTKDILYGDRFKLQNTMSIVEEPTGGVTVNTWTDVIWVTPLPWTHGVIKHVIEKKAKSDSAAFVGQLVQMIAEAASE